MTDTTPPISNSIHATVERPTAWAWPPRRRGLQKALGVVWLVDASLQCQPYMFTDDFAGHTLHSAAQGNPRVIADSVNWAAGLVARYPVPANLAFAAVQFALALGLFWPRTAKTALAASIGWSLAVWWLGEGLGGSLTDTASALMGAPGAAVVYAILAVLLWPARRDPIGRSIATGSVVGATPARLLWLVVWGSLAYFVRLPTNLAPNSPSDMIAAMADGEPGWLAGIDQTASDVLAGHGLLVSNALGIVFLFVAVGVYLPKPILRGILVVVIAVSALIWVFAQNLGGMLTGQGTDPNSGPLLILLAVAFWPPGPGPRRPMVLETLASAGEATHAH